jgi:predicted transcriptional regulator
MATRTTTIRLAPALRKRVEDAARRAGQSSHAFILAAIARTLDETEEEAAFDQLAAERWWVAGVRHYTHYFWGAAGQVVRVVPDPAPPSRRSPRTPTR